jgi:hypothetical protein
LARLWPLLRIVFEATLLVNIAAGSGKPGSSDTGAQVIAYYSAHGTAQVVSALLVVSSIVVGMCWFGGLRGYVRRTAAEEALAAIGFGGAVIFAVGGCMGVTPKVALSDAPSQLPAAAAQALNVLQNDANFVLIPAGIAVLTLGYGIAVLRGGLMATWLGWLSIAIALVSVVAATGPIWPLALLAGGVWVLIVSVMLYRRGDAVAVS